MMNEKSRLTLRVVAGLYLAYLGVKMIQGLIADKPENMIFMLIMAVIFVIVGVLFIILSVKSVIKLKNEGTIQEDENHIEDMDTTENDSQQITEDKTIESNGSSETAELPQKKDDSADVEEK
jgi:uncharacterized membrane protein YcjF (UPF0283 family)